MAAVVAEDVLDELVELELLDDSELLDEPVLLDESDPEELELEELESFDDAALPTLFDFPPRESVR